MKILIILMISLFSITTMAQDTTLTKRNLNQIFTKNANGKLFGWKKWRWNDEFSESYKNTYNLWVTINDDSAYYKSDTVTLYNHNHPYSLIEANEYIKWLFKKRNIIGINNFNGYTSSAINGYTDLKIKHQAKNILIILKDYDKRITKFKVSNLSLSKIHPESEMSLYVMTLIGIE